MCFVKTRGESREGDRDGKEMKRTKRDGMGFVLHYLCSQGGCGHSCGSTEQWWVVLLMLSSAVE